MPEPFRHRLRVRWSECDLQGVVFYPNYFAYVDHAITELWREAIGPYAEMRDAGTRHGRGRGGHHAIGLRLASTTRST